MSSKIFQSRLGPKPFSTEAADISFDKVFAVPTAPTTNDDSNRHIVEEKEEEIPAPAEITEEKVCSIFFLFFHTIY